MRTYTTRSGATVRLKDDTVNLRDTHRRVLHPVIDAMHAEYKAQGNLSHFVITSAADGQHSDTSKHYGRNTESGLGEALDFRIWHLEDPAGVARRVQRALGSDYDVVYGDPSHLDHIHIEYDPA